MKTKFSIVCIISFLAVMSISTQSFAQGNGGDEDKSNEKNKYVQRIEDKFEQRMDSFNDGEQDPMRGGGRRGMGGPGRDGRRGGFGRGMFGPPMSTDELMEFLGKHETEKAGQLRDLYNNQPEEFERYIGIVCELYTPAARMMENNPETGMLMVQNISLSLDVKKIVSDYNKVSDSAEKEKKKTHLKEKLSQQFDVILKLQEKEISGWQDRISQFRERMQNGNLDEEMDMDARGRRRGRGPDFGEGMGMQDRFQHMQKRMTHEVSKRKQDIVKWKEQKAQIVERQLADLIEDVRPFPWNR